MHEPVVADVNADVIDVPAADPEEHQVAALELAALHAFGLLRLRARGPRHVETEAAMREEHETAAVESLRRRAAVAIGNAAHREGVVREHFAELARVLPAIPFR